MKEEKLDYKLTFNGFSPSRTYVEIKHKGQYVISITYVEKMIHQRGKTRMIELKDLTIQKVIHIF